MFSKVPSEVLPSLYEMTTNNKHFYYIVTFPGSLTQWTFL